MRLEGRTYDLGKASIRIIMGDTMSEAMAAVLAEQTACVHVRLWRLLVNLRIQLLEQNGGTCPSWKELIKGSDAGPTFIAYLHNLNQ